MNYGEIVSLAKERLVALRQDHPAMGYWEISTLCRKVAGAVDAAEFLRDNLTQPNMTDLMEITTKVEDYNRNPHTVGEVTLTDVVRSLVFDWLTVALRAEWDRLTKLAKEG